MLDGAKNAPPHMKSWTPTRVAGLERLHAFAPYMGRAYANTRNADLGPDDRSNVSALSPWVRHRLITEEEILKVALEKHSFSASEKFVQELLWRTYFKGWLERRPQAWTRYQADLQMDLQRLEKNAGLRTAYDDAISGATGIEGFDDWASELVETGYLHNHARMWFASIWIFT
ncbi:MAG: FAD-binding domain-containing protein, partial [Pseudomonadota bacterium]